MVFALEWQIDQPEIYLVSLRKYNIDPQRPLWQKLFFRCVYLPVVRFAYNHADISMPSARGADGRIELIEQQGVYFDEKVAAEQCKDGNYAVKKLPLHHEMPTESFKSGEKYPRAVVPNRFNQTPPKAVLVLPRDLARLTQAVDEVVKKSREAIAL